MQTSFFLSTDNEHLTQYIIYNVKSVQKLAFTYRNGLFTLARPSTSSSLRTTDRFFQYASPRLWNQLPASLRQPRANLSNADSPSLEWHFFHRFHWLTHPLTLSFQV